MDDDWSGIEQKFAFHYPALYRQLAQDGMLYCGELGPHWYRDQYPVYRQQPSLLLFASEFELMYPAQVVAEIEVLQKREDDGQLIPGLRLIPFGTTGAGDVYCFFLSRQTGPDVPIVLMWHDSDCLDILAKNLGDFIFRKLLETVADIDSDDVEPDSPFHTDIQQMLRTHLPYLPARQQAIVQAIYARPVRAYSYELPGRQGMRRFEAQGLLTADEMADCLAEVIGFADLDLSLPYSRHSS